MATNPMQKKTRNAFILGMLSMLVIAAIVIALLYMTIQNQKKEISKYQQETRSVYVLNQDVKSGQILTPDMFSSKSVATSMIPVGATEDINLTLTSYSLTSKDGRTIYYNPASGEESSYYYVGNASDKHPLYMTGEDNQEILASILEAGQKVYFYAQETSKQGRTDIEVSENAVIAKVNMNANTVITTFLISRSNEVTTNDLRKEEYNVISLPVDLEPDEYVDIRLRMPTGEDYIVVSKKKVSIPMVNGEYLPDTIQMNLTEEEILMMSGAIVENYKIKGSELHATRYTDAGIQTAAAMTYYPSNEVTNLISSDSNVVRKAIAGIQDKRQTIRNGINSALSKHGEDENIETKVEERITSTQDARKKYLQTLIGGYTQ